MVIRATGDNLYCHIQKAADRKVGSIILPDAVQRTHAVGTVLSKGEDVPEAIKVGDVIFMSKRAGQDVMMDDQEIYKVVKYAEVYGVAEEE